MSDASAAIGANRGGGSRSEGPDHTTDLTEIRDLIKSVKFCMLTTIDEAGTLHSRPMAANHPEEFNGELYMFTYCGSHKCGEIGKEQRVNLSFADPSSNKYASLSGVAELIRDKSLMEQKWVPSLNAWFPKGLDEPDMGLLKVRVTSGEFWSAPNSLIAHTYGLIKGKLTGVIGNAGTHKQVHIGQ